MLVSLPFGRCPGTDLPANSIAEMVRPGTASSLCPFVVLGTK